MKAWDIFSYQPAVTRLAHLRMKNEEEVIRELDKLEAEDRLKAGFDSMDTKVIAGLPDDQLAIFHSKYAPGTPQFIRAEHEWQRRLSAEQIRSGRFAIWMGVVGTLAGTFLGWLLSKL